MEDIAFDAVISYNIRSGLDGPKVLLRKIPFILNVRGLCPNTVT